MKNKPDLRKFNGEVAYEDKLCAVPLFLRCRHLVILNLVLVERGNTVDDHPGNGAAKVDELVH